MDRNKKAREQLKKDGISKEQIKYERRTSRERAEVDIACLERELKYKQDQIEKGIVEKNQSTYCNCSSFPKDEAKPQFLLENEIEIIERRIAEKKDQIEKIKEMENAT